MGFLSRLFGRDEQRDHPGYPSDRLLSVMDGWETASGVQVTPESALNYTAVLACVRVLSESVAQLPLVLYERLERGKRKASNHPLYALLHDAPNAEMTAFEFRETLMGHLLTWGNAFAEIERNGAGRPVGLWPLRPDRMRVEREGGRLVYVYRVRPGEELALAPDLVLHLRGLGSNGVMGYSPLTLARQAIGLGLAAEEFGSRFFGNGARPGVILEHPGRLSDDAHKRLRESWEERHRGLERSHRAAILEEGMKVTEIGIPPGDAQFLETRKFQRTEIASIFRVPPHMIGDLERATFSNIEHQGIEFVVHALGPWLVRWEQRIARDLLMPTERQRLFAEHLVTGLLRGDTVSRFQAYATGRQWGWLSANDVRALENLNPVPDGDVYLTPLNMAGNLDTDGRGLTRIGGPGRVSPDPSPQSSVPPNEVRSVRAAEDVAVDRRRLRTSFRRTLRDVAQRVVNREVNDVRNAARRILADGGQGLADGGQPQGVARTVEFERWLDGFVAEHVDFVERYLQPVLLTLAELVVQAVEAEMGAGETDEHGFARIGSEVEGWVREYVRSRAEIWTWRLDDGVRRTVRGQPQGVEGQPQGAAGTVDEFDPLRELELWLDERQESEAGEFAEDQSVRIDGAVAVETYRLIGVTLLRWLAVGDSCPYCRELDGRTVGIERWFVLAIEGLAAPGAAIFKSGGDVRHPPLHKGCDCVVVAGA